ncbi:MAG: NTP transferase domain-containing protein [Sphingomonadaceae bacterium]
MSRHAVILAAGAGSRLAPASPDVKPLVAIEGKPLLRHALDALVAAGVASATVVVGREGDAVAAVARTAAIPVDSIENPLWHSTPNGVSLLAARERVQPGTLLMMADHLVTPSLIRRLVAGARGDVTLGVDRRLGHPWVDEADVTRVRTDRAGNIRALGKNLLVYDAYDCGVFVIGPALLAALDQLSAPSLSEGVMALETAATVDIGASPWLDVDDARALAIAHSEWRRKVTGGD